MVNKNIITSLKNAIERGESLDDATTVAINSGYNPGEVEEARRYLSGGFIELEKTSEEKLLTMPNEKKFFLRSPQKSDPAKNLGPVFPLQDYSNKRVEQIGNSPYLEPKPLQKSAIQPTIQKVQMQNLALNNRPKQSYTTEIVLLIILLILILILIAFFVFRDKIISLLP